jgi:hypothetical protein
VDAWRAAAAKNGVELVAEAGDLVLVHEADRWELRFARDPATRFPLPPPASPEHRAAVLALAARLLAESPPATSELNLDASLPVDSAADSFVMAPPSGASPESGEPPPEAEQGPDEREPAAVTGGSRPPTPSPGPEGWVVGLQGGAGTFLDGDPRITLALVGGARLGRFFLVGLAVETGLPVTASWNALTIRRDSARAEVGVAGFVLGAGIGRAEIVANGELRGQLLFPVISCEYEYPLRAGPLWFVPRVGGRASAAEVTLDSATGSRKLAPYSFGVGLRVERVLGELR